MLHVRNTTAIRKTFVPPHYIELFQLIINARVFYSSWYNKFKFYGVNGVTDICNVKGLPLMIIS